MSLWKILTCFLAPPTNESLYHEWTVGAIFYSILAMPEVLGNTNTSRVMDLFANSDNDATPAYAIYENDQLARVALFNYMTDPTGAMALNVSVAVGGGETGQAVTTPSQVKVKYVAVLKWPVCFDLSALPGISLHPLSVRSLTSLGRDV